nr:PIG-L family deacetylase [Pseudoalteromonas sp. OOF1S-7]
MVVVAHPDDEVLGFGATGAKLVQEGEVVQAVILCGNVQVRYKRPSCDELYQDMLNANKLLGFETPELGSFPNIQMNTVPHLEIVQFIEKQIEKYKPTRIFTHHPADLNDDHKQVSAACLAAARYFQRREDIPPLKSLSYLEIQSATDWGFESSGDSFKPNHYVEVEDTLEMKLQALGMYRNVMRPYPHPRSVEAITGLAAYRGAQAGQKYSESFQTIFQQGF